MEGEGKKVDFRVLKFAEGEGDGIAGRILREGKEEVDKERQINDKS